MSPATVPSHGVVTPRPATASPTPLGWLARGLSDLLADPLPGLLYGLIVSLLGWLILALGSHPYFIAAAVSGFVLVGPVLGAGLAELSRLRGRAEHGGFAASLDGLSRRRDGLLPLAGSLGAVAALWFLLSTLLMWVFMDEVAPTLAASLWDPAWKAMTAVEWLAWGLAAGCSRWCALPCRWLRFPWCCGAAPPRPGCVPVSRPACGSRRPARCGGC